MQCAGGFVIKFAFKAFFLTRLSNTNCIRLRIVNSPSDWRSSWVLPRCFRHEIAYWSAQSVDAVAFCQCAYDRIGCSTRNAWWAGRRPRLSDGAKEVPATMGLRIKFESGLGEGLWPVVGFGTMAGCLGRARTRKRRETGLSARPRGAGQGASRILSGPPGAARHPPSHRSAPERIGRCAAPRGEVDPRA